MTNEILFLITTVVSFSMVLIAYRFFGKAGMFVWMAISTVLANIEVIKCVDMFGLATALGNVIYGSTFLCTDILSEMHGEKEAKKAVWIGFFFMVCTTILMQLTLLFVPNAQDFANDSLKTIFSFMPRFVIVGILCFLVSNRLDVFLFSYFGKKTKKLWVKNNAATMIAQFVDTTLYTFLAFGTLFGFRACIEIIASAYIMKLLVAMLDTPFLYAAKELYKSQKSK